MFSKKYKYSNGKGMFLRNEHGVIQKEKPERLSTLVLQQFFLIIIKLGDKSATSCTEWEKVYEFDMIGSCGETKNMIMIYFYDDKFIRCRKGSFWW